MVCLSTVIAVQIIAGILVGLYLISFVVLVVFQRRFLFLRNQDDFWNAPDLTTLGLKPENSQTGQRSHLPLRWYLEHKPGAKKWFVVFHGNRFAAYTRSWIVDAVHSMPYHFVVVEYPGYSKDPTSPSMKLFKEYALDVLDALKVQENLPFVLFGESLGTGIVNFLGSEATSKNFQIDRVILNAPYDSITRVARSKFWMFPVGWVVRDSFPAAEWAKKIKCPILILHGTQDETVPFRNGENLLSAYPKSTYVEHVEFQGCKHKDMRIFFPKEYFSAVHMFLEKTFAKDIFRPERKIIGKLQARG